MEICYITHQPFFISAHSGYNWQAAKEEKHAIISPSKLRFNLNFPTAFPLPFLRENFWWKENGVDEAWCRWQLLYEQYAISQSLKEVLQHLASLGDTASSPSVYTSQSHFQQVDFSTVPVLNPILNGSSHLSTISVFQRMPRVALIRGICTVIVKHSLCLCYVLYFFTQNYWVLDFFHRSEF
jgi:hypothetical protein